jgi:hypothetical protein
MGPNQMRNRNPKQSDDAQPELDSIEAFLEDQDNGMRSLFAKALNLFVAPGMDGVPEREKLDQLRQAIDESIS